MRKKLTMVFVVCQILVLAYMAGEREYILYAGEKIVLRTAPIDPRDVFRGDFVRLNYDISSTPVDRLQGDVKDKIRQKDYLVYSVLKKLDGGLSEVDFITDKEPDEGVYLRGRVNTHWRFRNRAQLLRVRYGIEQLFVEQGAGLEIEKRRGKRRGLQIPMEVEVAVSSNGKSVIKGYRWSPLGIQLEVLRAPRIRRGENAEQLPLSPRVRLSLQNVSGEPIVLFDPGDHCGIKLVPAERNQRDYQQSYQGCENVQLSESSQISLNPEQKYSIEIDFTEPRWHLRHAGKIDELGELPNFDRFRLVYQSPSASQLKTSGLEGNVWLGALSSSSFNNRGNID